MKISPIAGGIPSQGLGEASTQRSSPDRIAAAKAIAAGESQIQLTPSENNVDPQIARAEEARRKIKMRTNASPDRALPEEVALDVPPSGILETTEQALAVPEEIKPLSPQLAAIAKQRRALDVREKAIADREKALESRPTIDGAQDLIARLKSDPMRVLQEQGVTYDQLTEAILSGSSGVNPDIQALKEEIKALKEGVDKNFTERDTQAEQQVLAEMRREAELLAKDGDAFEMVRETRSVPDVMELIHRTYKTTGEVLGVSEAMELVENELISESLKIANIRKVQAKLAPPPAPEAQVQQTPQPRQMRTLTNRDNAALPVDRRTRAIMAANGTLKR